jgi:deazaflavin-dependent oxidoreductase (nitroreductase family)
MSARQPQVAPHAPALIVRAVLAPMTRILNPLVGRLAGRRHFTMVAQIHHIGRRSGRNYVTPVGARVSGRVMLIPLTFGNRSDWARNVCAAGECWVLVNGATYHAVRPVFLDAAAAGSLVRAAFGPMERFVFTVLGIKQFMRMQVAGPGPSPTPSERH